MTRLAKEDIQGMEKNSRELDEWMKSATGASLLEIGAYAMGKSLPIPKMKVAVVPVTSGLGIITGFSEKVRDILTALGMAAFVTGKTDVAGVQEAFIRNAEVVFMADDETFSAFHLLNGVYSDNSVATGRGFAAALYLATGRKSDIEVLVLGAGPVGQAAMDFFQEQGIAMILAEPESAKRRLCQQKYPELKIADDWTNGVYDYVLEATPRLDLVTHQQVRQRTIISAPGVPRGVTSAAAKKAKIVIHNLLELGVATMLVGVS